MPSVSDMKSIIELGLLTVAAFAFIGMAIWDRLQLKPIIANNTKAIEALTIAVSPMTESQRDAQAMLEEISEKVVTKDELIRVHDRLDNINGNTKKIMGKVGC